MLREGRRNEKVNGGARSRLERLTDVVRPRRIVEVFQRDRENVPCLSILENFRSNSIIRIN